MSNLVSKCGINCGACPWGPYPRKGMSAEDFEQYRNEAKNILGYMPIKTPCVTCQAPDAARALNPQRIKVAQPKMPDTPMRGQGWSGKLCSLFSFSM